MRRLNVRALVILLASGALLSAAAVGVHRLQIGRNAGALLEQGLRLEEEGRYPEAVDCLHRYLRHVPDDAEALARYGVLLDRIAVSVNARVQAYLAMDQALRLDPSRQELRRSVIRAALRLRRPLDAIHHIEILLETHPDDGELELALGQCLEATGDYMRAADWLRKGVGHAPSDVNGHVHLAELLRRRLHQSEEADQVMDRLVKANAQSSSAYLARARYRKKFAVGDYAADVERARELSPDDVEVLLLAAETAVDANRHDEAAGHLKRGMALEPKNAALRLALVRLHLRRGEAEPGRQLLEEGLRLESRQPDLLWSLADLQIQTGRFDDASETLSKLSRSNVPEALRDFHRARILLGKGQWLESARLMERIRAGLNGWPDLPRQGDVLLGQAYEQLGDTERQLAAYRRALAADPLCVSARHGLGSALLAAGRLDEAVGEYRRLVKQAGAPPAASVVLARLLVLQTLRLPSNRRDWSEADGALTEAAEQSPNEIEVPILRAEILASQGQNEQAERTLNEALEREPDHLELWSALAGLIQKQGDLSRARETLERAAKRIGDTAPMRLTFLGYWVKHGGAEARREVERLEAGWERFPPSDRALLRRGLAEASFRLGDGGAAARHWNWIAEQKPDDLKTRLLLFDLAAENGDDARMRAVLADLRRIEGEGGSWWRYGEVLRLLRRAKSGDAAVLPEARKRLAEIGSVRPNWSRVLLLQAEIEELAGNQEVAINHYQQAFELGHRHPEILRRVVQLLYDRRRYFDADQIIRQLEEQSPLSGDLRRLAAAVSLQTRDHERAVFLAREAVRNGSKDQRDYIWLGQILWMVNQSAEAEQAFRQAVQVNEAAPDGWVALIQHLARAEKHTEAETLIEQARNRVRGEDSALALAQCFEAIGRRDRAEELFREALEERPDEINVVRGAASFFLRSGQSGKAEPLLRRIVNPASKARPEHVAWARRTLAVGLAARGGFDRFREAMNLMEAGGAAESPDDQRARAVVLATRPGRRRQAIGILDSLVARGASTPDDQFLLAQLYENDHDWPKARETMLMLLSGHGHNAAYVAYYVRSLLKHGERTEAEHWIAKLDKLESRTWRATELKARLLQAHGQAEEAQALLLGYARLKETSAGPVAVVLDQLGQAVAAEEMYRKYAAQSKRPESVLVLAEFLGRQGRVAEALDLCREAWKTCNPETVAGVCVAIIRAGNAQPEQLQQVESWIRAASDENPGSIPLLMSLAETWYLQSRYDESVGMYRRVLARDKRNVVALNNLAWLLALKERKTGEALELVKEAVELAGGELDLLDSPTTLYLTVGQRNLVIRDLVPDLLDTRAVVYLNLGRNDLAIRDLEDAIAKTATAYRYFHLAQAYQGVNDRRLQEFMDKANELGLKAEDLHPLEREAFRGLSGKTSR